MGVEALSVGLVSTGPAFGTTNVRTRPPAVKSGEGLRKTDTRFDSGQGA